MNPRRTFQHVRDFQSRSFGRSDTSPRGPRVASPESRQGRGPLRRREDVGDVVRARTAVARAGSGLAGARAPRAGAAARPTLGGLPPGSGSGSGAGLRSGSSSRPGSGPARRPGCSRPPSRRTSRCGGCRGAGRRARCICASRRASRSRPCACRSHRTRGVSATISTSNRAPAPARVREHRPRRHVSAEPRRTHARAASAHDAGGAACSDVHRHEPGNPRATRRAATVAAAAGARRHVGGAERSLAGGRARQTARAVRVELARRVEQVSPAFALRLLLVARRSPALGAGRPPGDEPQCGCTVETVDAGEVRRCDAYRPAGVAHAAGRGRAAAAVTPLRHPHIRERRVHNDSAGQ